MVRLSELGVREKAGLVLAPLAFVGAGFGLSSGLEYQARWALGVGLAMAVLWITESIPLWVTALFPLLLFPMFGIGSFGGLLLEYFDPVNFLFMGGMMLAASLEEWNVHQRIALGMVAKIGTSPRRIVLGFMLTTAFLSLWISNTAAAVMLFPIGMAVLGEFKQHPGATPQEVRRLGLTLMLGIGYAASIGGIGCKIGTGTNLVFVKQSAQVLSHEVSFLAWFKVGLPVVLIALPLAWLYLVRVAAPLSALPFPGAAEIVATRRAALGRMSRGEVLSLLGFSSAALLWVFRQEMDFGAFRIPGWSALVPNHWAQLGTSLPEPLKGLFGPRGGESVVALAMVLLLMLLPAGGGRQVLSLKAASGINWGILLLLGGGFAMASGITQSGLTKVLTQALHDIHDVPPLLALIGICLFTTGLSEVASNTATASMLLPVLASAAPHLGLSTGIAMFAATLAASFGFMLPAGTPPNAVVFSSGYIPVTSMVKAGLVVDLVGSTVIALVCYFLAPWALGY
ncbi:MAG TPA: SLC13 family permease [Polyangiaceae bacterium]|nr:SLC13 family permease [Polyangiaceae bacterium]